MLDCVLRVFCRVLCCITMFEFIGYVGIQCSQKPSNLFAVMIIYTK